MKQETEVVSMMMGSVEYVALLLCMLFVIIGLFLWRQRLMGAGGFAKSGFPFMGSSDKNEEIKILSQRVLDMKNRILLIENKETCYLLLVGATHATLIDKFPKNQKTQNDFSAYLKEQNSSETNQV